MDFSDYEQIEYTPGQPDKYEQYRGVYDNFQRVVTYNDKGQIHSFNGQPAVIVTISTGLCRTKINKYWYNNGIITNFTV